jgi:hypothetical protein
MRNLRTVRGARIGIAALALALTAGACGAEREGEDPSQEAAGSESADATAAAFGDLESPCGEGDAAGATDQGVTDDTITIGYGDDRGFASAPGLNQEMGDAVKAMIDWCNEQGGINGRQVVGNQYDAAMTNAASVVQKSCKQDFMLVGQGFAYDEASEQFRVGCDLPTVAGFVIGPNASMGPDKFEAVPLPVDYYNGAMLASAMEVDPAFADEPTTLGSTSPAIQTGVAKVVNALGELGADVKDCGVTLSQEGEANYVPFAEKLKECDPSARSATPPRCGSPTARARPLSACSRRSPGSVPTCPTCSSRPGTTTSPRSGTPSRVPLTACAPGWSSSRSRTPTSFPRSRTTSTSSRVPVPSLDC